MSAITPNSVAEALTSGDNDYDELLEGWFGLSATDNVVHIRFSPERETETGSEGDKENSVFFEAHVFPVGPPAPVAAEPVELPAELARELSYADPGHTIDGWTVVAKDHIDNARWESIHRLVIRNEAGEHYMDTYRLGLTEYQDTEPWEGRKAARFTPVVPRTRVVEVVEYVTPAQTAKTGGGAAGSLEDCPGCRCCVAGQCAPGSARSCTETLGRDCPCAAGGAADA